MVHTSWISFASLVTIRAMAALLFLYAYYISNRRSALLISLSWITSIPTTTFGFVDMKVENVFIGMSFALWYLGIFSIMKEETTISPPKDLILIPSIVLVLFSMAQSIFGEYFLEDAYCLGGLLGIVSGSVGRHVLSMHYHKDGKMFGTIVLISGLLSMCYPPIYKIIPKVHEMLIGAQIVALALATGAAYFYYRVIFSPRFLSEYNIGSTKISKVPGVQIVSPEDFENIRRELENLPVLAFLRSLKPADNWHFFTFTTAQVQNGIQPTDLYKVPEIVRRYVLETSDKGIQSVVVIEGVEYLKIYNEFSAIAKMLGAVRDYIIFHQGVLIVVVDKMTLDEREYALLRRVLG